ncbi:MAG: peroxiredoxin [Pseudomonadota bacterium]
MTIKIGDKLPDATFIVMTADGPDKRSTADVFGGRKIVLFAVPGAFTPSCHANHLPGYVEQADAFKAAGIDAIACTSANDVFVLDAWAKASGAEGIEFLSDGSATFMKAIGLDADLSGFGMGTRSKRYAMIVDDGVVTALEVEDSPPNVDVSSASHMLKLVKAA